MGKDHPGENSPHRSAVAKDHVVLGSLNAGGAGHLTNHGFVCFSPCLAAPSPVSSVKKRKITKNSISLSWQEPDRPNGIILEYEIKYFEKV